MTGAAAQPWRRLDEIAVSFHNLPSVPLAERAEALAQAGFRKIGLSVRRTLELLATQPVAELVALLRDHDLTVAELEVLSPLGEQPDPAQQAALQLAYDLGCPAFQVVGTPAPVSPVAVARLAELRDQAAAVGATLRVEFLPFTSVPDLAAARALVAQVPGVGICLDSWHLYRSGDSPSAVAPQDWADVASLQFNDGPLRSVQPDDLEADCRRNRQLPGEGEFDLVGLLAAARTARPDVALSVEVLSLALHALPPSEVAARLASSVSALLGSLPPLVTR